MAKAISHEISFLTDVIIEFHLSCVCSVAVGKPLINLYYSFSKFLTNDMAASVFHSSVLFPLRHPCSFRQNNCVIVDSNMNFKIFILSPAQSPTKGKRCWTKWYKNLSNSNEV